MYSVRMLIRRVQCAITNCVYSSLYIVSTFRNYFVSCTMDLCIKVNNVQNGKITDNTVKSEKNKC